MKSGYYSYRMLLYILCGWRRVVFVRTFLQEKRRKQKSTRCITALYKNHYAYSDAFLTGCGSWSIAISIDLHGPLHVSERDQQKLYSITAYNAALPQVDFMHLSPRITTSPRVATVYDICPLVKHDE